MVWKNNYYWQMKRIGLWYFPAGMLLLVGCATLPPIVMYGGNPADPSAPVSRFRPPPNVLVLEVGGGKPEPSGGSSRNTSGMYVCPMHPEIAQPDPGLCPKCHMHLRRKGKK